MQNGTPLTKLPVLVALKAISNGALAAETLPNRIKLLNWGKNETVKGPVIIDDISAAALAANQNALGYGRVAIDFEHNTVPGSAEYERTKEPRDVAGYGTPEYVPGDGLYLSGITWTASGQASAKNFSDLSPAPGLDAERRVIFLHSVALVRNGAVHDLTFYSAAQTSDLSPPTSSMTPEQFAAAIKPLQDSISTLSAEVKTLKETKPAEPVITLLHADKTETKLTLAEAGTRMVKLEADFAAVATSAAEREKAELITRFSADGKVPLGLDGKALTAEQLAAFPLEQIKMLHANTPATVPLSARGKKPHEGKGTEGLTGLDRAIAAHAADRN